MVRTPQVERFHRALSGEAPVPPVRGMTFVDPALLPGARPDGSNAELLATTCSRLHLDFAFVPAWEAWAEDATAALASAGVAALAVVPGVVWPSLERLGVQDGLRMAARDPGGLAEVMDETAEASFEAARTALTYGASALVVADDMAGGAAPLFEPRFLIDEAMPRLARLAAVARSEELPALLHCDGDARALYRSVADAGFRAVHGDCGGAGNAYPSFEAARAAGLAFVGAVPTAALTDLGTAALAGAMAGTMACAGGVLVADDGGVSTPAEVAALMSALAAAAGE